MIPWVHLDTARVPGGGELRLMCRGNEYSIMSGNIALMNSRMSGSEEVLGEIACDRLGARRKCSVLIGGYGMGFTLRAALAGLGGDAKVVVAELVPRIMEWARGPLAHLTAGCLDDRRVRIHNGDVGQLIASARSLYDAILLDVDNGPDAFSRTANHDLYTMEGLKNARRALRPGGLLAVWSAAADRDFTPRLMRAGFEVEEVKARAHKGRGFRHIIWVAKRRGD